MEFVVLGVLLFVGAVIAVDAVASDGCAPRARSTSGRPRRAAGRARPGDASRGRGHALAREQATPVDVYRLIGDTLEVAGLRPACRTERRSGSSASAGATTTR